MPNTTNSFITFVVLNSTHSHDDDDEVISRIHKFSRAILISYSVLLCFIGIPANILATSVLRRRALSQNFLTAFLTWLAFMNICCLIIQMSRFIILGILDFNYRHLSFQVCIVHRWLTLTTTTSCNWLVVMITLMRWVYLRFPGWVSASLKPCRVCIFNSLLVAVTGALQGLLLHMRLPSGLLTANIRFFHFFRCEIQQSSPAAVFSQFIVCFCPILLLAVFSILIYTSVRNRSRSASGMISAFNRDRRAVRNRHLALLLLVSNLQFIITNLPAAVLPLTPTLTIYDRPKVDKEISDLALLVTQMLMYGGYATNCIIYCFFGSRFRAELLKYLYEKGFCPRCFEMEPIYSATRSVWTSMVEPSVKHMSDMGAPGEEDAEKNMASEITQHSSRTQNINMRTSSVDKP